MGDMRQIGLFLFIMSSLNVQQLLLSQVFLQQSSPNINETVSNESISFKLWKAYSSFYTFKNLIKNACNCETGYIYLVSVGDMG